MLQKDIRLVDALIDVNKITTAWKPSRDWIAIARSGFGFFRMSPPMSRISSGWRNSAKGSRNRHRPVAGIRPGKNASSTPTDA